MGILPAEHHGSTNARYYSPARGRFISEDPSGFAAGDSNLYRYVDNQPTCATDPTGLYEGGSSTGTGNSAINTAINDFSTGLGPTSGGYGNISSGSAGGLGSLAETLPGNSGSGTGSFGSSPNAINPGAAAHMRPAAATGFCAVDATSGFGLSPNAINPGAAAHMRPAAATGFRGVEGPVRLGRCAAPLNLDHIGFVGGYELTYSPATFPLQSTDKCLKIVLVLVKVSAWNFKTISLHGYLGPIPIPGPTYTVKTYLGSVYEKFRIYDNNGSLSVVHEGPSTYP